MKRHFGLPIAIAAALHLALLFGFRAPATPANTDPVKPRPVIKIEPDEVVIVGPRSETEGSDAGGRSTAELPHNDETLRPPKPGDHIVPLELPRHNPATFTTLIPTEPFAVGHGPGEALGISGGPVSATALDRAPRAIAQIGAVYPFEARKDGLSGEVIVAFTVDPRGEVQNAHVMRSTSRVFEDAALRAVAKWRFEPGRQHGRLVTFRMAVPVVFRLDEAGER